MATPRKLTDAERRLEGKLHAQREAARAVGTAQTAIEQAKARHEEELKKLNAEFNEAQVEAVVVLGAKLASEILDMKIPAKIKTEAQARITAREDAKQNRRHPAPAAAGGPEAAPDAAPAVDGEATAATE